MMETKRLLLREMNPDDFQALFRVLGDPVIMQHYPYAFDEQRVRSWIERNMNRYREIEAMTALSGDHPRYIGWAPIERVLKQKPKASAYTERIDTSIRKGNCDELS